MFLLPFEVLGLFAIHCHEGGEPCVPGTAPAEDVMDLLAKLECAHRHPDDACNQLIEDSKDKVNNAVIALIDAGGDVDKKDKMKNSILYNVAWLGYADAVKAIAEHGSELFDYAHPFTPLMGAALKGHSDVAKILLKNGANANVKNHNSEAAIHFAVRENHQDIVENLIDAGADMNLADWQKFTALHLTAKHNLPAMARMLIEKGADLNPQSKDKGYNGYGMWTPLAIACLRENEDVAKVLLDGGADPNIGSVDGTLPLHYAAEKGKTELVRALISNGAEVNAQTKTSKKTALMEAARNGKKEVINILLENGADASLKDKYGSTANI